MRNLNLINLFIRRRRRRRVKLSLTLLTIILPNYLVYKQLFFINKIFSYKHIFFISISYANITIKLNDLLQKNKPANIICICNTLYQIMEVNRAMDAGPRSRNKITKLAAFIGG